MSEREPATENSEPATNDHTEQTKGKKGTSDTLPTTKPATAAKPDARANGAAEPAEGALGAEGVEAVASSEPSEPAEPFEGNDEGVKAGAGAEAAGVVIGGGPVEGEAAEAGESADGGEAAEPAEVSRRYDCSDVEQRAAGLTDATSAVRQGKLVVIPTDTVYGIGADAFTPSAVNALLEAKGRGRDMPVPVLVGSVRAANALIEDFGAYGQDLVETFWPGPLTLICRASRSLQWDLGETKGTVALRMPLHAVALDLLKETGPMAVSSANRSGAPPATTAAEAEEQLGDAVSVYLDGGRCVDNTPSTILDLTTPVPRVLRKGAIPVEKLRAVVGYLATED